MKTYNPLPYKIQRDWQLLDADNIPLGRLAVKIATLLRGKHKPIYTPHIDTGDYVIVVNAQRVIVTGNKTRDKIYRHYTGYPGGQKERSFTEVMKKNPAEVIELAVKGMLPKNPLGRAMFRKLKVYAGETHPHVAQLAQFNEIKV